MKDVINWLHLTDLHLGLDKQSWLWPRIKHELFRDIEKLSGGVDSWDLVFFTGDFVQSGQRSEFDQLNKELEDLWKVLTKGGHAPQLCAIPGNHDILRPPPGTAITKTLSQLWMIDEQLRQQFWADSQCEYRVAVTEWFANYSEWISKLSVPLLSHSSGILPGDFGATFTKGSAKLGIVGLNTTFLQITSGDMKGRLDMHVSQLNSVCGGDPEAWIKERTSAVLLTHQPPSWLTPESLDHFREEIYPPGRFLAQLCGHQHEPETFELSEAGGAPRRLRQGPSLFGIEKWVGATPTQRVYGYNAGQFIFDSAGGAEKLWPRIAAKGHHGGMNLGPDTGYTLTEGDCVITRFVSSSNTANNASKSHTDAPIAIPTPRPEIPLQLLENAPNEEIAKRDLAFCPRLSFTVGAQHRYVRQDEQSQCELALRKSRCVWVIADWGSGADGFLATVVERFKTDDTKPQPFHLKCDEATDSDELESIFSQQFGTTLQTYCHLVSSLNGAFLVLDGVHPNFCKDQGFGVLERIVRAVIDYCPKLRLIMISRCSPPVNSFPTVTLQALDAPDVRSYIMNHSDAPSDIGDPDTIEKLHERSEGLPMHLDRMLKALKVTSLASVFEAELEGSSLTTIEEAPHGLVHAVTQLAQSADKRSKRSFRLLKVLSVLPYGETLEFLSHYLAAEPFFLENALQLNELTLLDVVLLPNTNLQVKTAIAKADQGSPKLLRVPRQVRDYVQTLLSDEERLEIVLAGLARLFGRDWRDGKVRLRRVPLGYQDYLASGAGNEFAVIHHLIAHARAIRDSRTISQGAALGIQYVTHLIDADRYRDASTVAGALIQQLDRDEQAEEWCRLAAMFGQGLRMTGRNEQALEYLRDALEGANDTRTDAENASVWLDIALAEQKLRNVESAIAAAEKVKEYSKPNSGQYLYAEFVLATLGLKGDPKIQQLAKLEMQARKNGNKVVADTIALEFAREADSSVKKIKHLNKVLESEPRGYNHARAIVAKAEAIAGQKSSTQLHGADLFALSSAYSYLHAQRFSSLFDRSHEQLWRVFEMKGDSAQLVKLFRHTSFIWRIRGDENKEAEYLKRLEEKKVNDDELNAKGLVAEVTYFFRRLRIVVSGAVADASK